MPKHKLTGKVVSNKMNKTVVVEVERIKQHPKYKRRYKVHKRYKAHDEKEEYNLGDKVVIEESRPQSKDKRWTVVRKIGENREKSLGEAFDSTIESEVENETENETKNDNVKEGQIN
ncbi:MAG: 30S ribosomal protein S17 [Candidatus Nealsonbacteria bacterium CG_4_10_14_0_2_um_filter_38_17]|uniref:Small ribosomal subunit protein uS17 n=2 Tax=Candidatus Nealsoniibacteriota TaxID=1817911 RepID=A0A2M7UY01_9BACT|nr:MAG: 30S ribosomal protein S17 [Candidatus Nealsonbacteria bacterium CG23_combo_of_CG06-09_8_20_14_all_38_19]PIZ88863.1 MAG: 30S ribosomal protein S17 [Candidatus Nealsonbacteria bacterium CG_4_10_14_0_2_um_filter_38_17]